MRDLKGKRSNDSRFFGYVSVGNQGDVIIAHCIFWYCVVGLFVTALEVLFSADKRQSLKKLFHPTNFEGGYPKSRSILTAWEPLAIHPRVRANHGLIGLGCGFKNWTTKNFFIL